MKLFLLIFFALYSIMLVITNNITVGELYIGTVIFMAAEYIEDAIQRNDDNG